MLKNVKIAESVHRLMSIRASQMGIYRGDLCTALLLAALEELDESTIRKYLAKTEYPNQDQTPPVHPKSA